MEPVYVAKSAAGALVENEGGHGRDRSGDPLLANSESEFGWSEEE
jgi:hypothetical protein